MPDDVKRRSSRPGRRVRLDARAEPDSAALPEPEAVVVHTRRGQSVPVPRAPKGGPDSRPGRAQAPAAERPGARASRPSGGLARAAVAAGLDSADVVTLRRQVAALQQELSQTQLQLASLEEGQGAEADRLEDALAQMSILEIANRDLEERLAATGRGDEARRREEQRLRDALAEVERREARQVTELMKLTTDLDQERSTSQWLRDAGEKATREVAAFRARATAPEIKPPDDPNPALVAEVARLTAELAEAKAEIGTHAAKLGEALTVARGDTERALEALRREHTESLARAKAEAGAHAAKLEEALGVARGDTERALEALRREHAEGLAKANAEQAASLARANAEQAESLLRAKAELASSLAQAKAEAGTHAGKLEEALTVARGDAERALEALRREHAESLARAKAEHEKAVAAALKDSDEQVRAMATQLSTSVTATNALRVEKESLAQQLEVASSEAKALAGRLEGTTAMLASIASALVALDKGEEQVDRIRSDARIARATIAEKAVALRLALDRAVDGVVSIGSTSLPPEEVADSDWDVVGPDSTKKK